MARQIRIALFRKQSGRCHWCGHPMRLLALDKGASPDACTIEHLEPRSKGGNNHPRNLRGACLRCNRLRGNLSVEAFVTQLAALRLDAPALSRNAVPLECPLWPEDAA